LIGWLERKIAKIEWLSELEPVENDSHVTFRAIDDIPGYDKILTISSPSKK
jgi:hypothetical protein